MAIQTFHSTDTWIQQNQQGIIPLPIGEFIEQDATAMLAFSAAPTPGYALMNSEALGIKWGTHANPDPIGITVPLPYDLDPSADIVLKVLASKTGATLADAVTWLVTAFFLTDAALHDADANAGGTSSAMTGDAAAKTVQLESLTIAAADVANPPAALSLTIQPTDGTLGTDDVVIYAAWLEYTRSSMLWKTNTYVCRILVPIAHKLSKARLYAQNIVTTGAVLVQLRQTDPGDGRGGALVGTKLENDDLSDVSSVSTKLDFVLSGDDKKVAPANRQYFLVITGTDPADRVDEPTLVLEVDDTV
jgi:hypothetical protein